MTPVAPSTEARQKTGGPSCQYPVVGSRPEAVDFEARVAALEALTTADLRIEWGRLYRAIPPTRLSRDLLLRGVAYRVQEHAYGGLSLGTKRMLRSLCERSDRRRGAGAEPAVRLKPGTKLVREWHGQVHTVSVLDDGFEYQGERYPSLTRIAGRITGVHRSGPVFFGLKRRSPPELAGTCDN
jgi:hypothetical protein